MRRRRAVVGVALAVSAAIGCRSKAVGLSNVEPSVPIDHDVDDAGVHVSQYPLEVPNP